VKDVVFGICAPAVLQPFLKQALANMPPDIKIITLIVNSTLHAEDMRGEIESMKAVDAADHLYVQTYLSADCSCA